MTISISVTKELQCELDRLVEQEKKLGKRVNRSSLIEMFCWNNIHNPEIAACECDIPPTAEESKE